MKFFGLLFLLLVAAGYYIYPSVAIEKKCYDIVDTFLADVKYYSASRGWSQNEICEKRSNALLLLGDCLGEAKKKSTLSKKANTVVEKVVDLQRPLSKKYSTLKSEHNTECIEYSKYQLEDLIQ